MAAYGYSRVPEQGFMGFAFELQEGVWGEIQIPANLMHNGMFAMSHRALGSEEFWKLRMSTTLGELAQVVHGDDPVSVADRQWDATQRKFNNQSAVFLDDDDPEIRAAAERVRSRMTLGGGTEQINLSYEKEIDFGRSQVFQASREPLRTDIRTLGLDKLVAEISTRTEALASARGRGTGDAPAPFSHRLRAAKAACSNTFNIVHDELDWLIERTPDGAERTRLIALRAPLIKLLERYPTASARPVTEPAEPPAGNA